MAPDSDTNERGGLAQLVVATSGPDDGRDPIAALVGGRPAGERLAANGVTLGVEDLLADGNTRHELLLEDRVEYLPCVADALEAAVLVDQDPVTVRSVDPVTDQPVTFEITDDDVDVTPVGAVVSIGMAEAVPDSVDVTDLTIAAACGDELPGGRDPEDFPSLVCAYVNAFESVETYEEWADDVEAVSVAVPAEKMLPGIREFVDGPAFD